MSKMTSTFPTRAPTPCYRQAYYRKKSGEITEADYFHSIFMHLVKDQVYHEGDGTIRNELEDIDPLGYRLNCWIMCEGNRPYGSLPILHLDSRYMSI
jgi:hypothetical protein